MVRNRHWSLQCVALVSVLSNPALAQIGGFEYFNPISSRSGGVHLYSVTFSSGYFSNAYGLGATGSAPGAPIIGSLGGNADPVTSFQAAADLGWTRPRQNSSISVSYSPTFFRTLGGADYNSVNHSVGVSLSRTLTPKWAVTGSVSGILADFKQLLFSASPYGSATSATATLDDLFGAFTGKPQNPDLTQILGGAAVITSPETAYAYGSRLWSVSASLAVSYAQSSRSTVSVSANASRSQSVTQQNSAGTQSAPAIPGTTAGSVAVNWAYSLTPRTTASVNFSSTRRFSKFQDAYNSQGTISIGRTLSPNWFVQGMAGVGFIQPIRSTFTPNEGPQKLFGGSIGYKLYAQTLLGSYTRSLSDVFGYGASSTDGSTIGWSWKRPGRTVSVSAMFGYYRMIGSAFTNSPSWTTQGGVGKAIGSHFVASLSVSHATLPRTAVLTSSNLSTTGVNVSLSWSPSIRQ